MKCKDCEYWKPPQSSHCFLACDMISQNNESEFEVRQCCNPLLMVLKRPNNSNGFAVVDTEDNYAALYTAENFGCVLFKKIEN
jgi:hypothetical protein